jgi:hypothetical protein
MFFNNIKLNFTKNICDLTKYENKQKDVKFYKFFSILAINFLTTYFKQKFEKHNMYNNILDFSSNINLNNLNKYK